MGTNEKQTDAGGYSNTAPLTDSSNVDVLVQVVKEAESQYPSNYVEEDSSNLVRDEATVEVDTVFENCEEYTEQFGYTSNVCQTWLDDKISSLTIKRDAAGKFSRVFDAMIDGYRKCSVTWEQPTAPLVDISDFSRDSAGYPNVDTSEKLVETESY